MVALVQVNFFIARDTFNRNSLTLFPPVSCFIFVGLSDWFLLLSLAIAKHAGLIRPSFLFVG